MIEPTYTLKASDPLAMGLLSVLACLRAGEFGTAQQQFVGLMQRAVEEGPDTEEAVHAAWSVAADMLQWGFDQGRQKQNGPAGRPALYVVGDTGTGALP